MSAPRPQDSVGGGRLIPGAATIGMVGLLLVGLGWLRSPAQALTSFLVAEAAGVSLALGAIGLVMICELSGARWFAPIRPIARAAAATIFLYALLFLVPALGLRTLYPWVPPLDRLEPGVRAAVRAKEAYLNPGSFLTRTVLYFAIWMALATLVRHRPRLVSAVGLIALGLSTSFAAFDWLMSLSPAWSSTVYGLYYFAGGMLAAVALLALLIALSPARWSPDAANRSHALGNLMLTVVLLWAYLAYCQFLVVWIADIPAEAAWYLPRIHGSWGGLGLVLLLGQFALPFLLLLFRPVKRSPVILASIGAWLLLMHWLDLSWLVLPELHRDGIHPHWLDLAAACAVAGLATAWGAWRYRQLGAWAPGLESAP